MKGTIGSRLGEWERGGEMEGRRRRRRRKGRKGREGRKEKEGGGRESE